MSISIDQIIVWVIIGIIGGSLAGLIVRWDKKGFGLASNIALGLVGALVGGMLFRLFGIWPDLDRISISLRDILAAVLGSLLVLLAKWLYDRYKSPP